MPAPSSTRNPVSPKVALPSLTLAIATVITAITSGDFGNTQFALAVATVVVFVVGYITHDPLRAK